MIGQGKWRGVNALKQNPAISHLLYADNVVLFAEVAEDQVGVIKEAPSIFSKTSGQKVNFSKSTVFSRPIHPTRSGII